MPEIRFYASKEDLSLVFEEMFTELEFVAFELISDFGEPLQSFHSVTELSAHFGYCGKHATCKR